MKVMDKSAEKDIEMMFLFLLHEIPKVWGKDKQKLRDRRIIQQIRELRKTQTK
jgi:hypothetical protein